MFALGGNARIANRGTSNKNFIRHGAKSTTVEIKLQNSGEYGYRQDVYGNALTIIRHATASGGGR